MKKDHQYNFRVEHAKPIFTNIIGSKLVGCDNEKSDIDTVTTYAHKTILNPFFDFPSSEEIVNISYTDNLMYEDCAVLAINNIAQLIRPNDISASTTGWLIHHLAAVKFDRIEIHDKDYYSVYLDYLSTPGLGQAFWKHAAQQTANSWNAMPTSENNWSQHFDSNNQTHIDNKNTWQSIVDYYPTVDKTAFVVKSSKAFSARATSSLPASPSLAIFSRVSLALRRMLRIAMRASSALDLATLMNSLRRSSVNCGKGTRTIAPSFEGLTPRSESRIARSIAPSAVLSNGVITATRGSGV